jgi:hypothetical protein
MKIFDVPAVWSSPKFAARYGLDYQKDYYVGGDGKLRVFPAISDDPPIFEAPDLPLPTITSLINQIPMPLKTILLRLAEGK